MKRKSSSGIWEVNGGNENSIAFGQFQAAFLQR
jgi:hypothetical protein